MTDSEPDPYKVPEANLVQKTDPTLVTRFKRQSAWVVFGLAIITLGIYPYIWLYTQTKILNEIHEKPIPLLMISSLMGLAIVNLTANFWGQSEAAIITSLVFTLLSVILYVVVVFKFRDRLQDILTRATGQPYQLSGILAFFFYAIYFQYKINECFELYRNDT